LCRGHALDPLGATNTLVLNLSSFTRAMGVYSAESRNRRGLLAFLGIKTVAHHDKYVDHHIPGASFSVEDFVIPREAPHFSGRTPPETECHRLKRRSKDDLNP
jgi:hypothetical protein